MERAIDTAIGSVLGGKYRIEDLLGRGGMGAVYLAENLDIGRKVAIKVLHASFANDAGILQRFRMEARAAAAIGHPGIVDVLDLGTTADGAEFIVMERLDGETLGARIKRLRMMRPDEVVPVACEVLDALAAAHDKGIVHRDLKPENIFLCERPLRLVKILDFGISKFSGPEDVSLTATGTMMGSPLYMSPEQVRSAKDIGSPTDLYSLGAILYEALAGVPPFGGVTLSEVIANVLMERHRPLLEIRPELTPELSAVIDSLLAKTPGERPPDARAAKAELRRALEPTATDVDMPTAQQRDATLAPMARTSTRAAEQATFPMPDPPAAMVKAQRRLIGIVAGAGALIVAGVIGFALYHNVHEGEHSDGKSIASKPIVAPPIAPPAAPKIELSLRAEPVSATLTIDGETLRCNPCTAAREAGSRHLVTAAAAGYATAQRELVFDRAREERFTLDKVADKTHAKHVKPGSAPPTTKTKPDDAIDIDRSNPFRTP